MEGNSQDEDPDEALKRYYAKMKEKRKKQDEKKGEKKSVLGEAKSTDKEGQDMHDGNTLTTLSSSPSPLLTRTKTLHPLQREFPHHHFTLHVWVFKPSNTT